MPKDQNLQRALDFIDKNVTQDISLYDIAKEAGFSVPHFYRLFRKLTGDTVGAYILRRRIAIAARALTGSNKSVSSIAYECGFESHDAFTRAFTRVYGITPKKYRCSNEPPPLKKLSVISNSSIMDEQQMKFSLLQVENFYVIGIECEAKQWDSNGAIGKLWSDFLSRANEIKHASSPMIMYGICEHETCNSETFRYMAAIGVTCADDVPLGMVKRIVRKQKFFQACVPEHISVPDAYSGTSGYAKSLGCEIDDYDIIEVYEEIFQDPDINSFKLLIPIK